MSDETALSLANDGSTLRLKAAGEWIAQEAARLEPLTAGVAEKTGGASRVEIDLTGVTRLDTLGAMLLYQTRGALEAKGVKVDVLTGNDKQRILLEEVASHESSLEQTESDSAPESASPSVAQCWFVQVCRGREHAVVRLGYARRR